MVAAAIAVASPWSFAKVSGNCNVGDYEPASPDRSGARCDRDIDYDRLMNSAFLKDNEKALAKCREKYPNEPRRCRTKKQMLADGDQVSEFVGKGKYYIGYVFQVVDSFDPELVMGVFTSADEHAGKKGLGDYILQSCNMDGDRNPYRTFLKQQVDLFDDGRYVLINKLSSFNTASGRAGYILDSRPESSADSSFSPRWVDAYFKAIPHGSGGSLVAACNYMVPRSTFAKDTFNKTARERIQAVGRNLLTWLKRVANTSKADVYRQRVKTILSN